jgi:soluble P-type ATPase
MTGFASVTGKGVRADVQRNGIPSTVLGRHPRLLADAGIETTELEPIAAAFSEQGKTPVFAAVDGRPAGVLAIADPVKDDSVQAIAALHRLGVDVVMITGDNARTAAAIAARVGVQRVLVEVLPEHKADEIRRLQAEGRRVGMVGDGINDAPALAAADIGLAIGTGTDVAIEAADITLISGSLSGVVTAIALSRTTMRTIRQNLFFALVYNAVGVPVAAGALTPAARSGCPQSSPPPWPCPPCPDQACALGPTAAPASRAPPKTAARPSANTPSLAAEFISRLQLISGLLDGSPDLGHVEGSIAGHGHLAGLEVDVHRAHPGDLADLFLDRVHTVRAGHSRNGVSGGAHVQLLSIPLGGISGENAISDSFTQPLPSTRIRQPRAAQAGPR